MLHDRLAHASCLLSYCTYRRLSDITVDSASIGEPLSPSSPGSFGEGLPSLKSAMSTSVTVVMTDWWGGNGNTTVNIDVSPQSSRTLAHLPEAPPEECGSVSNTVSDELHGLAHPTDTTSIPLPDDGIGNLRFSLQSESVNSLGSIISADIGSDNLSLSDETFLEFIGPG